MATTPANMLPSPNTAPQPAGPTYYDVQLQLDRLASLPTLPLAESERLQKTAGVLNREIAAASQRSYGQIVDGQYIDPLTCPVDELASKLLARKGTLDLTIAAEQQQSPNPTTWPDWLKESIQERRTVCDAAVLA